MTRRLLALLLTVSAFVLIPAPASAEERPPARKPAVSLELATSGMAEVRQAFRIAVDPAPKAEGVTAALQVKSAAGYVTQQRLRLDARGRASGLVVSNKPATRTYRAVLLSARGRILAISTPVTVTWTPLAYTAALTCSRSSAPIRVDIPCTITVAPTVRMDGMIASLQVMGRTEWVPIEASRVPLKGVITTHVEGLEPGIGMYRVLLLRDAKLLAESPTISIAYSAP